MYCENTVPFSLSLSLSLSLSPDTSLHINFIKSYHDFSRTSPLYNSIEWFRKPTLNTTKSQESQKSDETDDSSNNCGENLNVEEVVGEKVNFVAIKLTANEFTALVEKDLLMQHTDYAIELNPKSRIIYILEVSTPQQAQ
jgi:hypothetical protein